MKLLGLVVLLWSQTALAGPREACEAGHDHSCYQFVHSAKPREVEAVRRRLVVACGKKVVSACWSLANSFVANESPEQRVWFERACALDHVASCSALGRKFAGDAAAAFDAFAKACALDKQTCRELADAHIKKLGPKADPAVGLKMHIAECTQGSPQRCWRAAQIYERGEVGKPNLAAAADVLKDACETFNESCLERGILFLRMKDEKTANKMFARMCPEPTSYLCPKLVAFYLRGADGIPPRIADAGVLLDVMCMAGVRGTCGRAVWITHKSSVPREATRETKTACDGNDEVACTLLGITLEDDDRDDRARAFYRDACGRTGGALICEIADRIERSHAIPPPRFK